MSPVLTMPDCSTTFQGQEYKCAGCHTDRVRAALIEQGTYELHHRGSEVSRSTVQSPKKGRSSVSRRASDRETDITRARALNLKQMATLQHQLLRQHPHPRLSQSPNLPLPLRRH